MATTARTASLIFLSLRLGMAKFSSRCGPLASIHSITLFARATSMEQRLKTSHASAVRYSGRLTLCRSRVGHQHQPKEGSHVGFVADRSHPKVVRRQGKRECFQIAPGG